MLAAQARQELLAQLYPPKNQCRAIRPMQRRVLRTPDLAGFRRALVDLAFAGDPLAARRRVVIVPTRASAELLRQTIEAAMRRAGRPRRVLPDLVTRDEWIARLHDALPGRAAAAHARRARGAPRARRTGEPPRRRAAGAARRSSCGPGLVAAMLDFYDELRRRQRTVRRFARALLRPAARRARHRSRQREPDPSDLFSRIHVSRLRARRRRERRLDEHVLCAAPARREQPPLPFDHVVIAVADHPVRSARPLAGRLRSARPAGRRLGARRRRRDRRDARRRLSRSRSSRSCPASRSGARRDGRRAPPVLVSPAGGGSPGPVFVSRDREEEVRDVARAIRADARRPSRGAPRADGASSSSARCRTSIWRSRCFADARRAVSGLRRAAARRRAVRRAARSRAGRSREPAARAKRRWRCCDRRCCVRRRRRRRSTGATPPRSTRVLAERRATGEAATYPAEVDGVLRRPRARDRLEPRRPARGARRPRPWSAMRSRRFAPADARRQQVGAHRGVPARRHERPPRPPATPGERAAPARARGRARRARRSRRRLSASRRSGARPTRTLTAAIHHAIEAQTFTPRRGADRRAPGRRRRRALRRVRPRAPRRPGRDRLARAPAAQHLLHERPAARRSAGRRSRTRSRAQQAAFRDLLRLPRATTAPSRLPARGRRHRRALADGRGRARSARARAQTPVAPRALFADEVLTRGTCRAPRPRRRRRPRGSRCAAAARRSTIARYSGFVDAQAAAARTASAASIATSTVRSSTSPRACSACPRSATRRRA